MATTPVAQCRIHTPISLFVENEYLFLDDVDTADCSADLDPNTGRILLGHV
jgi:hypothetical protein